MVRGNGLKNQVLIRRATVSSRQLTGLVA